MTAEEGRGGAERMFVTVLHPELDLAHVPFSGPSVKLEECSGGDLNRSLDAMAFL